MTSADQKKSAMHPRVALFGADNEMQGLPVCDHYAGPEKLVLKALALQAQRGPIFDVTADCEDGAPIGHEAAHASMVASLINSEANQHNRLGVRIHDLTHGSWQSDIDTVVGEAGERLAFITIPKIESSKQLQTAINHINHVSAQAKLGRVVPVHILIESASGLADVNALAAHPRVQCISLGLLDFVSSFGGALPEAAMSSPLQFEHPLVRQAKTQISLACHAHGKVPSHSVCTNITDPAVAGSDAMQARTQFGFTRMWSIHPIQIDPIVQAMSPSLHDLDTASAILLAAYAVNWAPIQYQGRLHDRASYRHWWQVLAKAHAIGAALSPEIENTFFSDLITD